MKDYLVVWRGWDHANPTQSKVSIEADPRALSSDEWVSLAALSEDNEPDEITEMIAGSYDLFLVCDYPADFYV